MAIDRTEAINRYGRFKLGNSVQRTTYPGGSFGKDGLSVKINGIEELRRALADLPRTLRKTVLLKALRAGASVVQKAARAKIPTLQMSTPYRTKGLLKKKLTTRVSKESLRRGDVGVSLSIWPVKGGGAKNPRDPYYWKFVNWGTKPHRITAKVAKNLRFGNLYRKSVNHPGTKGAHFMEAGADALPAALAEFERVVVPAIEELNRRGG